MRYCILALFMFGLIWLFANPAQAKHIALVQAFCLANEKGTGPHKDFDKIRKAIASERWDLYDKVMLDPKSGCVDFRLTSTPIPPFPAKIGRILERLNTSKGCKEVVELIDGSNEKIYSWRSCPEGQNA